jgi:hypothetical protein
MLKYISPQLLSNLTILYAVLSDMSIFSRMQINGITDRQSGRQESRQGNRQRNRPAGRQVGTNADRQVDRKIADR